MRIFLTGASGYIGGGLCERLAAAGHELRILVRPTSDRRRLEQLGAACFTGDVTRRASMREAMSGADWVIHAAAELDLGAPPERMWAVNVEGTENVVSLAYKLGVGRLLAVSSMAAFGGSPADGSPADEDSPLARPLPGAYSETKQAADRVVAEWARRGLAAHTVYPGLVYGPPAKKSGANALLWRVLHGRLPAVVGRDRLTRWIFLDDLLDGLERVMERAEPGSRHLMTGEKVAVGELVERVCALSGVAPPRWTISPRTAALLAAVLRPVYRLRGRRPPLAQDEVRSLARHWNFDDARARRELDWTPRPLAEGLPATVEHLTAPRVPG